MGQLFACNKLNHCKMQKAIMTEAGMVFVCSRQHEEAVLGLCGSRGNAVQTICVLFHRSG